ncbi:MAG: PAS domain-containing protein [Nitriliruptoraceae bacterium]
MATGIPRSPASTGRLDAGAASVDEAHPPPVGQDPIPGVSDEVLRFMDRLPYLYWVADPEGQRYRLNRFGVEYTGHPSHVFSGEDLSALVHPADAELLACSWNRALAEGREFEHAYRFLRADGEYRWQRNWAMPIRDERSGALLHWFGFSHDLHDQIIAEEARARSEGRAQRAERSLEQTRTIHAEAEVQAGFGLWYLDVEAQVLTGSPGAFALLEHPGPQLSVEEFFGCIHEEDVPRRWGGRRWFPPPGGPTRFRFTTARGTERICEVFTTGEIHDEDGRLRITGTIHDVTAEFLATREARLWAAVAERAPMVLQIVDPEPDGDGRTVRQVLTNARGRHYAPLEPSRVAGQPDTLFDPRSLGPSEDGSIELGDVELMHDVLGRRVLEASLFRPRNSHRIAFAALDVTDRRRLEQERAQLLRESAWAVEEERRRIAEQLHDDALQLVSAALLRLSQLGDAERTASVRSILEATARSLRLTVLEIAQASLLADGLEETLREYARQLFEGDEIEVAIDLEADLDEWPEEVVVAVQRIVQEALSNARRHARAAHVAIRLWREEDAILGEVIDDGSGFDGSRVESGHLGIRLMRNRAESIGGHLTIRPGPDGVGTCVSFVLPMPTTD